MSAAIAIGAHALPPAPAPGPREGAGKAMETAAFASVIDALAPSQPHAASHADIGAIGDGGGASHPAGGKEKSPPRKAAHLELALANLPLVAPAAPQGGAMQVTATSAAQPLTKVAPGPVPSTRLSRRRRRRRRRARACRPQASPRLPPRPPRQSRQARRICRLPRFYRSLKPAQRLRQASFRRRPSRTQSIRS